MDYKETYQGKFSPETIVEARKMEQAEPAKRLCSFTKFHVTVEKVLFRSNESSFASPSPSSRSMIRSERTTTSPSSKKTNVCDKSSKT